MRTAFRKMHGLGNDFMVIDAREQRAELPPERIRELANRRTGIGFDQLLILDPPSAAGVHADYRIFNADGKEVEQCGNGVRCLARLIAAEPGVAGDNIRLQGPTTLVTARLIDNNLVSVSMGEPDFAPQALPFEAAEVADRYSLQVNGQALEIGAVSMGNPHAVLLCTDINNAAVDALGAEISGHSRFPRETNVEFMQIRDSQHIDLRVYERGVGETQACGTGACAAVAIGQRWGMLADTVEVALPGGIASVSWQGPGQDLWLTGPAADVFGGFIEL